MKKEYNKTLYLTRQEKKVIVGILNLRLQELKKWDSGLVEMYMFESTINDIIEKLEPKSALQQTIEFATKMVEEKNL
jgi:hypothetical protein